MKRIDITFRLTAVAAALMTAYGPAIAEDVAALTRPDSFVSLGVGNWSHDRYQQGIYDGMREGGLYGLFDAAIVKRDETSGTWYSFKGSNLGLDNRRIEAEVQQQGNIGAFINYSRISREHPLVINSGLQGVGTANLTLSGAGANALPFRELRLGTTRDLVHVGLYKNLQPGLDFKLSFKNEDKDGARHWGLGSQPYFVAEPIDSSTQQVDATLEYTGERLQIAGGYSGSWYGNGNGLVMALVNGAAQPGTASGPNPTPLTLPLDNEAHQFFVNAGYSFSPSTRATLKLSRSVATQDESLPSYPLAAPNNPFIGAPSSLDGEIVTSLVELGLNARPISDLTLSGSLRYHDVDDRTPLVGLVGNNATGVATVHNTPHSFTTTTGKLEASYRLPQSFRLTGGVDLKKQDRSFPRFESERYVPFRADLDETTWRLQLRRSMSETLNGAVTFLHSERDGSHFIETLEPEIFDQINPLHISDRERDKWRISLDWTPSERIGLQFTVEDSSDDYGTSAARPYGLQDGSAKLYSVDARFAINDQWQVSGWLSHDETEARQLAGRWPRNATSPVPDMEKDAHLNDKGDSVGIGVRGSVGEKLKLGADVQWTRQNSSYDEATAPARSATEFPLEDIENKLTRVSLFARYAVRKNADVRVDLIHERWETDDWTWSFVDGSPFQYGTTTDGTTVSVKPKQTTSFVGVRYIYRFQ